MPSPNAALRTGMESWKKDNTNVDLFQYESMCTIISHIPSQPIPIFITMCLYIFQLTTISTVSQISADYFCLQLIPEVITHCAICVVVTH